MERLYVKAVFKSGDISYCTKSIKNDKWYDIYAIMNSPTGLRCEYYPVPLNGDQLIPALDECLSTRKTLSFQSGLDLRRIDQIVFIGGSKEYHTDKFCETIKGKVKNKQ